MLWSWLGVALILIVPFIWHSWSKNGTQVLPTNWPFVGMIPGVLVNYSRLNDYVVDLLKESRSSTFLVKGPWLFKPSADLLVTTDPANIKYVMSQNYSNFPRGTQYKEIFKELGDGIFNSHGDVWQFQRKTTMSIFSHQRYQELLDQIVHEKIQKGLIPVLDAHHELMTSDDHHDESRKDIKKMDIIDLQEVFERYTLDVTVNLLLGWDPDFLSLASMLHETPVGKSFQHMEEGILYRHLLPISIWKLQGWIGIGKEVKIRTGWRTIIGFLNKAISMKQRELLQQSQQLNQDNSDSSVFGMLKSAMQSERFKSLGLNGEKFLQDTILNLVFAGRDTTSTVLSWFFWLVATHPSIEAKILDEIRAQKHDHGHEKVQYSTKSYVYLHAALCETMRLYPPVPFLHLTPAHEDTLPSGHKVYPNRTKIILHMYSMGRMECLWGNDCLEFKPERWISENGGGIKPVPSHVFLAFGSGTRNCMGKDTAFVVIKAIIIAMIQRYHIQVVQDHPIVPEVSVILHMKHGLNVHITKRYMD